MRVKTCLCSPYYGLSLLNRAPGKKKSTVRSGTLMGLQITEGFKDVSPSSHFSFFPTVPQLLERIFLPAMC